jgi:hypothetical protein
MTISHILSLRLSLALLLSEREAVDVCPEDVRS